MDRRSFLKQTGAVFLAGTVLDVTALAAPVPTVFYVDGYHGGSRGHMPPGSWRDILEALQTWPEWKLSLDVEPNSWEVLRREDPEAYRELQSYLADTRVNARVTLVGGTFAQPYGWAISGESNIRQLKYGLHRIHEHFPSAVVNVYAVQEPCWASCLPQILRSLGFKGASLKNASTAWGGYTAGFDAELVNWIGPDQTSIPAVPRYACEQLVNTWETEAIAASPSYLIKCVEHGIPQPVGMCFQGPWLARTSPRRRAQCALRDMAGVSLQDCKPSPPRTGTSQWRTSERPCHGERRPSRRSHSSLAPRRPGFY